MKTPRFTEVKEKMKVLKGWPFEPLGDPEAEPYGESDPGSGGFLARRAQ